MPTPQTRLDALRKRKKELSGHTETLQEKGEAVQAALAAQRERLQEHAKHMEKLLNKRNLLQEKRESAKRKISELGSLPDKELREFRSCGQCTRAPSYYSK